MGSICFLIAMILKREPGTCIGWRYLLNTCRLFKPSSQPSLPMVSDERRRSLEIQAIETTQPTSKIDVIPVPPTYPSAGNIGGDGFMLYHGNDGHADIPVARLIAKSHAAQLRARIDLLQASASDTLHVKMPDESWETRCVAGVGGST